METSVPVPSGQATRVWNVQVSPAPARKSVPCTGCHYCVSHCPQGLDIPRLISLYNEHLMTTEAGAMAFIAPMALAAIPEEKRPVSCLHCRSCEQVCPQQIRISDFMTDFVDKIG